MLSSWIWGLHLDSFGSDGLIEVSIIQIDQWIPKMSLNLFWVIDSTTPIKHQNTEGTAEHLMTDVEAKKVSNCFPLFEENLH